jgi:hypothetical protein
MSTGRSRDGETFDAMLLGALGGGRRLRSSVEDALAAAPTLAVARPLDAADFVLLGLLGFCSRFETLLGTAAPGDGPPAEELSPSTRPSLGDLLR